MRDYLVELLDPHVKHSSPQAVRHRLVMGQGRCGDSECRGEVGGERRGFGVGYRKKRRESRMMRRGKQEGETWWQRAGWER